MNKIPNHTALKEWASVIAALGRGEQVVLLRKGGIADPAFGLEAMRFYLFPTNFHEWGAADPGGVLTSAVAEGGPTITHWCEVVHTWQVRDLESLYRLESQVVFDRNTIETRYRFRPDQAVNVIAVRAYALAKPVTIASRAEYEGCRSWISIEEEIDIDGSTAALTTAELQARVESVDALLAAAV